MTRGPVSLCWVRTKDQGLAVTLVFMLLCEPTLTQKGLVGVPRVHLGRGSRVWPFETKGATPVLFPKSPHSHYGQKRSPAVGLEPGGGAPRPQGASPRSVTLADAPWLRAVFRLQSGRSCGGLDPSHPPSPSKP